MAHSSHPLGYQSSRAFFLIMDLPSLDGFSYSTPDRRRTWPLQAFCTNSSEGDLVQNKSSAAWANAPLSGIQFHKVARSSYIGRPSLTKYVRVRSSSDDASINPSISSAFSTFLRCSLNSGKPLCSPVAVAATDDTVHRQSSTIVVMFAEEKSLSVKIFVFFILVRANITQLL